MFKPCFEAGHTAAVADNKAMLFVVHNAPAEAVPVSVIVSIFLAAVQLYRREHHRLFLTGEHLFFPQRPVPGEHIEYGGVQIIAAVQAVRADDIRGGLFR